ncbi:hypothetical protein RIF29_14677 [Crotalaria pallida]|uniref:Uncharacterized protein n=1 Tax=Crotalaria pallida TaxID=3830 RepID=A0AAN9FDS3_CROPI
MNVALSIVFHEWTVKKFMKSCRNLDINVFFYHGTMDPAQCAFVQKQWSKDEINIICATVAFGMEAKEYSFIKEQSGATR